MDGRRGYRRNGDSIVHAQCKDYPLGCWRETVPTERLLVRFALCWDVRVEGLCVLQPCFYFTEYSRESGVILRCALVGGFLTFHVSVRSLAEPACRALVRSQRERCRLNSRLFERYFLNKREDVITIGSNLVRSVACRCIFC